MFYYIRNENSFYKNKKMEGVDKSFESYKNPEIEESQYIIISGGDGTLIRSIHGLYSYNKPFYGINAGNVGFLLNNIPNPEPQNMKDIKNLSRIDLEMIEVRVNGEVYQAFNEVVVGGDVTSWIDFSLSGDCIKGKESKFQASGVIISTPQGSTGMNKNNHGKVLDIDSNLWSITSDKGLPIINTTINKSEMDILYTSRHPVSLWIDGSYKKIDNPSNITISPGKKISLLFDSLESFMLKRK